MNDRGLELSIADLLKNFLFGMSGDRIDEVQQAWTSMVGTLEASGGDSIIVTYLRHVWASFNGPIREKELYAAIKKRITSKQAAVDFANILEQNAKLYAALLNPRHEIWGDYSEATRRYLETLIFLGLEQSRPLLLATLDKFETAEVEKTFRYVVSSSVRFLVVGGLGGGTIERLMSITPPTIRDGQLKTQKELVEKLKSYIPSDKDFEEAFSKARSSKPNIARYYLQVLEKTLIGDSQPELVPNDNQEEVNLEHVLPEHPSKEWGEFQPDDAKRYYKRIGNLTLTKQRLNSAVSNKGFDEKKKIYSGSKLKITLELISFSQWGISEIEKRQAQLSKLAIKAWPISF